MKCSIDGCPGEYEKKLIVHTIQLKGDIAVFDHVPAEVCSVCGDILLAPKTIRRIEELLREKKTPKATVPLFEYA
ncbi:MAG: YgiT-type zinc finger protein [Deferribacteres bacterium]|nr:YgiT-type zinc finger protein [candidate division KSB1 bacterium]MCB9510446.1 YgiT-type zinc finger protein [Deferribacteres bacterium]